LALVRLFHWHLWYAKVGCIRRFCILVIAADLQILFASSIAAFKAVWESDALMPTYNRSDTATRSNWNHRWLPLVASLFASPRLILDHSTVLRNAHRAILHPGGLSHYPSCSHYYASLVNLRVCICDLYAMPFRAPSSSAFQLNNLPCTCNSFSALHRSRQSRTCRQRRNCQRGRDKGQRRLVPL